MTARAHRRGFRMATATLVAAISFSGLVATAPATTAQAASLCTSVPFRSVKGSYYRIPAVVSTGNNRVLAFAEKRDNNTSSDMGNFDVVMRVSTNGGCSWGSLRVVANYGGDRVSNPVPIWDSATNSVLLFTSVRIVKTNKYKGLFMQRISADGTSWTSLQSGQIGVTNTTKWHGGLTGPGHGIVLQHGEKAGRIIFAMGYRRSNGKAGAYGIYSDDHGATWKVGYDRLSPGKMSLAEGTIAELPSGKLLVSYRDLRKTKPGTNRVYATSTDQGNWISTWKRMPGVNTMAVEGSLLQTSGTKSILLFSSPSFTATKNYAIRRDMRLFISTNGGKSWKKGPLLTTKKWNAAYSDLTQINSNTIGVLFENGKKTWRERITFKQVRLSSIR